MHWSKKEKIEHVEHKTNPKNCSYHYNAQRSTKFNKVQQRSTTFNKVQQSSTGINKVIHVLMPVDQCSKVHNAHNQHASTYHCHQDLRHRLVLCLLFVSQRRQRSEKPRGLILEIIVEEQKEVPKN
jgi:hypothetical protein